MELWSKLQREGLTWEEEIESKHWLSFWRNAGGFTWQGLRSQITKIQNYGRKY